MINNYTIKLTYINCVRQSFHFKHRHTHTIHNTTNFERPTPGPALQQQYSLARILQILKNGVSKNNKNRSVIKTELFFSFSPFIVTGNCLKI